MQIGVVGYVREVQRVIREALDTADTVLRSARKAARQQSPAVEQAVEDLRNAVFLAWRELAAGEPVSEVTTASSDTSTTPRAPSWRPTCPPCTPTWPGSRTCSRPTSS